ncbi:CatB-related O-acetyltransferase [Halarcobacter sp.]|uniref:CatB-related O-acetyltransferase n=1 Tax=Halarcobacter sp. TaxID=2321133 RepID=UPI0038B344C1
MNLCYILSKVIRKFKFPAVNNSVIHKSSKVTTGSTIINSTIDKYSYIGNNSKVIETNIGKFCSISNDVTIGGGVHPINWISTSPIFYKGRNVLKKNFSNEEFLEFKKTEIENDVWIGAHVLIKGGVHISNGAIIGMGSVVTKDIPPYEIWAGNPAKLIKKRFSNEIIKELEISKWWEESDYILKKYNKYSDVNEFIKFLKSEKKDV